MERSFRRRIDSLEGLFAFAEEFYAREAIAERHRFPLSFALEEIFTNLVKYGSGRSDEIVIALDRQSDQVTLRLTEDGAAGWDPETAPEPRTDLPLEERRVGGLGLFLTRKLMDSLRQECAGNRSTITMTKRLG